MKTRRFGTEGPELTELCIGPMRFDKPDTSGGTRGEGPRQALDAAIGSGITTVHSSAEYSSFDQFSEWLRAHPRRGDLQHIVKISEPEYAGETFSRQRFVDGVDALLTSLGTEQLTVLQHLQRGPVEKAIVYDDAGDPARLAVWSRIRDDLFETAADLRQQGKIGALSIFPHTIGYADAVLEETAFSGIVHYFNLIEVEAAGWFRRLSRQGQGFVALRPYLQGMLTDARGDRHRLPADNKFAQPQWDEAYDRLGRVTRHLPTQASNGLTDEALRFPLSFPEVTTVVVGLNTPDQVETAVAAADLPPLDADVRAAIVDDVRQAGLIDKSNLFG